MQINQILWVINSENQAVVPVKIVEKVTKETILGTKTEFIVSMISGKKLNLSQINGRYFEKSSEAYDYLLSSAVKLIKAVIVKAEETAVQFGETEKLDQQNVQTIEGNDKKIGRAHV